MRPKVDANMREGRVAIPSTAPKRAAAQCFQGYDSDATDSFGDNESETERLERYPERRPSPGKTAHRMRTQLQQAQLRSSGKKALKAEMDGECGGLALRSARRVAVAKESKLEVMPEILPEADGVEDEDAKPGSGQVFLDGVDAKRSWDAVMRARREVLRLTDPDADSSQLPKSDMGLFALLPGELRNRIYRFALVEGESEPFLVNMDKETCNLGRCVHMRLPTAVPGLLSACKLIRSEAMPVFIAENSFKFDDELVKARCVANWLRAIGVYASLLSKVILDLVCWEFPNGYSLLVGNGKVALHYEMTLLYMSKRKHGRWTLDINREISDKALMECVRLGEFVATLNREILTKGKAKELALLEFVWSDWLAKLVYICRK